MPIQHRADDLRADLRAALITARNRASDQRPLTVEEFRGGVPLKPQPPVTTDPHRPLTEELVRQLFRLGERRFRAHRHR
jgi:hypothetical protein